MASVICGGGVDGVGGRAAEGILTSPDPFNTATIAIAGASSVRRCITNPAPDGVAALRQ